MHDKKSLVLFFIVLFSVLNVLPVIHELVSFQGKKENGDVMNLALLVDRFNPIFEPGDWGDRNNIRNCMQTLSKEKKDSTLFLISSPEACLHQIEIDTEQKRQKSNKLLLRSTLTDAVYQKNNTKRDLLSFRFMEEKYSNIMAGPKADQLSVLFDPIESFIISRCPDHGCPSIQFDYRKEATQKTLGSFFGLWRSMYSSLESLIEEDDLPVSFLYRAQALLDRDGNMLSSMFKRFSNKTFLEYLQHYGLDVDMKSSLLRHGHLFGNSLFGCKVDSLQDALNRLAALLYTILFWKSVANSNYKNILFLVPEKIDISYFKQVLQACDKSIVPVYRLTNMCDEKEKNEIVFNFLHDTLLNSSDNGYVKNFLKLSSKPLIFAGSPGIFFKKK